MVVLLLLSLLTLLALLLLLLLPLLALLLLLLLPLLTILLLLDMLSEEPLVFFQGKSSTGTVILREETTKGDSEDKMLLSLRCKDVPKQWKGQG